MYYSKFILLLSLNEDVYVIVGYCLVVFDFNFLNLMIFDLIFWYLIKYVKIKW